MKRFMVLNSTDKEFIGEIFFSNTEITKMVKLPFTNEQYRCTMFNGMDMRLVKDDKEIIATLR